MKKIAIFLRKKGSLNKFRRAILNTLQINLIDEALICSGFFQDDVKYSAGNDLEFMSFRSAAPLSLTSVGLYSYAWKVQYENFEKNLIAKNSSINLNFSRKRIPRMGWHAKVFIAKEAGIPVVGIIGSSNITRRAFGESKDFNYECDVIMWNEGRSHINRAIEAAIGDDGLFSDVIVSNYDDAHRSSMQSLEARLIELEGEIMSAAINI